MTSLQHSIRALINFQDLTDAEMTSVMQNIMDGTATSAQIAGLLVALEMKGLTATELTAAAKVMRAYATQINLSGSPIIDIVGSGGDNAQTFNISTTVAFVVATAGGIVAKHGNRSISSTSGSADVLEAAGMNLHLTAKQTQECIEQLGIGFMFAPLYHQAVKHTLAPRKELGIRTLFNLLGTLSNPANAPFMMVGVYQKKWVPIIAEALQNLGCKHAFVVHSEDGLDEISISAPTFVADVKEKIRYDEIHPSNFGFSLQPLKSLRVSSATESLQMMQSVLHNVPGPAKDIVLLNSAAALYVAGIVDSLSAGVALAEETLCSLKPLEKFDQLIAYTQKISA